MSKAVFRHKEGDLEFVIYSNDHGKPHFSLWHNRQRYKYAIETLKLMGTQRPDQAVELEARKWAYANQNILWEGWSKVDKPGYSPKEPMSKRQKKLRRSKRKKK